MSNFIIFKSVKTNEYHIWLDALHARELARTTSDDYNRGAYVRWVITTSWTAFEVFCHRILETIDTKTSGSFLNNVNAAIESKGFPSLKWSNSIRYLKTLRIKFTHGNELNQIDLWAHVELANDTIKTIRNSISQICTHIKVDPPTWLSDDTEQGWIE